VSLTCVYRRGHSSDLKRDIAEMNWSVGTQIGQS
jgi:hypothetical protein